MQSMEAYLYAIIGIMLCLLVLLVSNTIYHDTNNKIFKIIRNISIISLGFMITIFIIYFVKGV